MSINFAFEKLPFSNLTSCKDINDSGISRIGPCPFSLRLIRNKEMNEFYKNVDISDYNRVDLNTFDGKYVVSVGVNHCPEEWTGWPYLTERQLKRQNIFEFLTLGCEGWCHLLDRCSVVLVCVVCVECLVKIQKLNYAEQVHVLHILFLIVVLQDMNHLDR